MPLRVAALSECIQAASPEEVQRLAPVLLELAVSPLSEPAGSTVRAGWRKWFQELFLRRRARDADLALEHVARCWAALPADVRRAAIAVGRGRWHGLVELAETSPSAGVRRSVAELVRDAGDARLADAAVELLADPDPHVAGAAEAAILSLALHASATRAAGDEAPLIFSMLYASGTDAETLIGVGIPGHVDGDPDNLAGGIARACTLLPEHRRRGVIPAAMLLLDARALRFAATGTSRGHAALASWFNTADEETLGAIRTALVTTRVPVARRRALEWLSRPALARAAATRLRHARSILDHELVLPLSHLALHPARARRLARVGIAAKPAKDASGSTRLDDAGPVPCAALVSKLSRGARRGLARWASTLGADAPALRAALDCILADDDVVTRHSGARAMPLSGLSDMCFDSDARVALTSTLRLSDAGERRGNRPARSNLPARLADSPHELVRRCIHDERGSGDPLSGEVCAGVEARRVMARDPASLDSVLVTALEGDDAVRRLRAVLLINRLGLTDRFAPALLRMTAPASQDTDARLAATAAAALAGASDPVSILTLIRLCEGGESRVRANAVEALAHRRRVRGERDAESVLVELKDDPHHRVRANAVFGLLGVGASSAIARDHASSLVSILTDVRPMHRLAGVWAASRTLPADGRARLADAWPELTRRIGQIAAADPDERVRARATMLAGRLDRELHAAWKQNVPWQRLAGERVPA